MKIIVVGTREEASKLHLILMENQIEAPIAVMEPREEPPTAVEFLQTSNCSNVEIFKRMECLAAENYDYTDDCREMSEDGISELREYFNRLVRSILSAVRKMRCAGIIFQPCWSSRRWRSVT